MAVVENAENINEILPDEKDAMNRQSLKDKLISYKKKPGSLLVMILVLLSAAVTITALAYLIVYILVNGIPYLSSDLFSWTYT